MTDGDALLAAVRARPDDDTPRLVYADWLDGRGEAGDAERAAFIRCQVELARVRPIDLGDVTLNYIPVRDTPTVVLLPLSRAGELRPGQWAQMRAAVPGGRWTFDGQLLSAADANVNEGTAALRVVVAEHPHAEREAELMREEQRLWELHGRPAMVDWGFGIDGRYVVLTPVADNDFGCGNGDVEGVFVRGFVESVELSAADWLAHADAVLAAHPVRRVTLTTWPGETPGWPMLTRGTQGGDHFYEGWEGVAFELPTPPVIPFTGDVAAAGLGGGTAAAVELR